MPITRIGPTPSFGPIKIEKNNFRVSYDYLSKHAFDQKITGSEKLLDYMRVHTAITACLGLKQLIGLNELKGIDVLEISTDKGSLYMDLLRKECGANTSVVNIKEIPRVPDFQLLNNENGKPYMDNSRHVVISRGILYSENPRCFFHWKNPSAIMENIVKNIYRILCPGGIYVSEHEEEIRRMIPKEKFEYKGIEINGTDVDIWQKLEEKLSKPSAILANKKIKKRGML